MKINFIIDRLKAYFQVDTDSQLAKKLGVLPTTLSNWKARSSIDYNLIFTKCENISYDWLLTGEGEMLKKAEGKADCTTGKEIGTKRQEDCILCKEKDRLISELEKHKETQEKFIDRLHKDLFHCEEELEEHKNKQKRAG
ncbi:MAG: helix-turn-helix domain-containing protein [Cyclobacteriaceae bacterium]